MEHRVNGSLLWKRRWPGVGFFVSREKEMKEGGKKEKITDRSRRENSLSTDRGREREKGRGKNRGDSEGVRE